MIKKREKKYSAVMYDIANILWIGTADSGYSLRASGNIFSALSPLLDWLALGIKYLILLIPGGQNNDDADDDLLNLNLLICPHTHGSSTPLPSLMLITASADPPHTAFYFVVYTSILYTSICT